jgi:hypothetical protein
VCVCLCVCVFIFLCVCVCVSFFVGVYFVFVFGRVCVSVRYRVCVCVCVCLSVCLSVDVSPQSSARLDSVLRMRYIYGKIDLNIEVCRSNSHVYGTVTLAANVAVYSGASHLQNKHLAMVVRRNQRPNDSPNGQL